RAKREGHERDRERNPACASSLVRVSMGIFSKLFHAKDGSEVLPDAELEDEPPTLVRDVPAPPAPPVAPPAPVEARVSAPAPTRRSAAVPPAKSQRTDPAPASR